ncbi:hypothetical protein GGR51DRAFT_242876 [Nemania sp. FL0031]|nr:hypothetical protein GGR51DRAFT_242876 [Nemania sp. FL0031]
MDWGRRRDQGCLCGSALTREVEVEVEVCCRSLLAGDVCLLFLCLSRFAVLRLASPRLVSYRKAVVWCGGRKASCVVVRCLRCNASSLWSLVLVLVLLLPLFLTAVGFSRPSYYTVVAIARVAIRRWIVEYKSRMEMNDHRRQEVRGRREIVGRESVKLTWIYTEGEPVFFVVSQLSHVRPASALALALEGRGTDEQVEGWIDGWDGWMKGFGGGIPICQEVSLSQVSLHLRKGKIIQLELNGASKEYYT